jgi:hypothetical protein
MLPLGEAQPLPSDGKPALARAIVTATAPRAVITRVAQKRLIPLAAAVGLGAAGSTFG